MAISYYCPMCDATFYKGKAEHTCKEVKMYYYRCELCDDQSITSDDKNNQRCLNADCKASHLYQEPTKPDSPIDALLNKYPEPVNQVYSVGKIRSRDELMAELEKEIWNDAIEAAALVSEDYDDQHNIRKLKK